MLTYVCCRDVLRLYRADYVVIWASPSTRRSSELTRIQHCEASTCNYLGIQKHDTDILQERTVE